MDDRLFVILSFDPKDFFRDYFGVCVNYDVPLKKILVRIDSDQRDYVETLPLHHSQRRVEDYDEYSVYEYTLHPTIDFFRAILAFGAEAELLAPAELRELFAKEAGIVKDIYDGKV